MMVYWVCTLYISLESLGAGTMDILRLPPLSGILLHLGYPAYFGVLLGIWKVLGAIVLVAPRSALFKEWAYAGLFIDFTAAIVSHVAVGDGAGRLVGPGISLPILAASWALRPATRRLATT